MKRFFQNVAAAALLAGVFVALVVVVGSQTVAFSATVEPSDSASAGTSQSVSPSSTAGPSASASASASKSPSATASASTSGVPVIANVTDDSLPVTGAAVVVASLFGGGLLALGVGLVALTRRRPTRFSA